MKKSTTIPVFIISLLVMLTLACGSITGLFDSADKTGSQERVGIGVGEQADEKENPQDAAGNNKPNEDEKLPEDKKSDVNSPFPLTPDAEQVKEIGDAISFSTRLNIEETMDFYRDVFTSQGLTERTILTQSADSGFSIVFDGSPNGLAIVVQGVDMGGSTVISIRYEET